MVPREAFLPHTGTGAAARAGGSEIYHALVHQIERENELVNNRISWTLQLNGFLFTALALLMGRDPQDPTLRLLLHWLMPTVGLCVSTAGLAGVIAAQVQLAYLTRQWRERLADFDHRPRPFAAGRSAYVLGTLPCMVPALGLSAVWFTVLGHRLLALP